MWQTAFEVACREFRLAGNDKDSPYTHMLLTGGKYCFPDNEALDSVNTTSTARNNQSMANFISQYVDTYGRSPTKSEYAYAMLQWWWDHRKSPLEGISLVSRRSDPLFFMYFDLDMKYFQWDTSHWIMQQRSIASIVRNTIVSFYHPELEMVAAVTNTPREISLTSSTNKGSSSKEAAAADTMETRPVLYKVGMHFYCPTLTVNFEEAMKLVHAVTIRVRDVLGERNLPNGENAWSDVFDVSVYRNGLRDCATFKTNPCSKCHTQSNQDYDKDSLYMPTFIVTDGGLIDITPSLCKERGYLCGDYNLLLHRLTRVRCSDDEATMYRGVFKNIYPNGIGYIPACPETLACPVTSRRSDRDDPLQYPIDLVAQRKFRNFTMLYFSPDELRRLECCIREHFNEARYGQVQIRSVYAFYWKDVHHTVDVLGKPCRFSKIKITLKGEGSRYCFNKGDHHNSNTAYFEIVVRQSRSLPRLEQRCWSPHSYKCHGAMRSCDRFRSGQIKLYGNLTKFVTQLLFHNSYAQPQFPHSP